MSGKIESKASDILTEVIIQACQKFIESAPFDKTLKAVVIDRVENNDHLYRVKMNGNQYTIPSSVTINKFPCSVWVIVPRGNKNNMFIVGTRYN